MRFLFDFSNYFKMIGLAWNEKIPRARYYYLAVLLIGVPIVSTFHAICFFLDGIFYPGLLKVEVRAPIFMVGHARSGTTLTHRLLSQDAGRFSYFKLYELYFPSLIQKKVIRWIARYDAEHWRGLLAGQVAAWEEWRYGRFRNMHAMGLTQAEEDDIVLYWSMAAGFWITKMPYMGDLDFYAMNDWSPRKRKRYNDFYRECVRRQLYLNGPELIHLSKNPMYSGRVESLIEAFPDCRIIVNVRNPYETIPSLMSIMRGGWKSLGWDAEKQQETLKILADQSFHTYLHPIEALDRHPETRRAIVDYRDLTSDPAGTLEKIYAELELPLSDAFRAELAQQGKRERKHDVKHEYSLEEYGLEADAIHRELSGLFERFGWDEAPPEAHADEETTSDTSGVNPEQDQAKA